MFSILTPNCQCELYGMSACDPPHARFCVFQKENEQKRRRKSKAQFFEMIQEIRRSIFGVE